MHAARGTGRKSNGSFFFGEGTPEAIRTSKVMHLLLEHVLPSVVGVRLTAPGPERNTHCWLKEAREYTLSVAATYFPTGGVARAPFPLYYKGLQQWLL